MTLSGSAARLAPGTTVADRYRVGEPLGRGGYGVVYEAEHVELGRKVALKVLRSDAVEDPRVAERFVQEARTAAAIGHPNIVEVFDLGVSEQGAFIAMERLEGEELGKRIRSRGPLDEALVARVGAQIADALAAAHEHGVIHRDIKPANVFLTTRGRERDVAKVLDFGIAKLVHATGERTRTGEIVGTVRFMAPEQLKSAKRVDGRADLYALGAVLYYALTGVHAHEAETYPELVLSIVTDAPRPLRELRPDVSDAMAALVEQAMEKDPDGRAASARELADRLHAIAAGEAPASEPPLPSGRTSTGPLGSGPEAPPSRTWWLPLAAAAALAGVVVVVLGWTLWGRGEGEAPETATDAEPAAPDPSALAPPEADASETVPAEPPASEAVARIHLDSDPSGAQVRLGDLVLCGATPCDVELPELPAVLVAELAGRGAVRRVVAAPAPERLLFVLPAASEPDPPAPDPPATARRGTRPPAETGFARELRDRVVRRCWQDWLAMHPGTPTARVRIELRVSGSNTYVTMPPEWRGTRFTQCVARNTDAVFRGTAESGAYTLTLRGNAD